MNRLHANRHCHALIALVLAPLTLAAQPTGTDQSVVPVTVKTFARAESDMYFAGIVKQGGFGKFRHSRVPTPIDQQDVVRMNRDTLYSSAVFDLDAGPVTIALPDAGKRFMSLLIISEDHYAPLVGYAPGRFVLSRDQVGTRYVLAVVRTLADPGGAGDMAAANALQDRIRVEQASAGRFEVPNWDPVSQGKIRDSLNVLGSMSGQTTERRMGKRGEVDPIQHLIATAIGWGLNPDEAAVYVTRYPKANDGKTVHRLTLTDVPVDGFWSISVYNANGYFEANALNSYSINSLTSKPNDDGSITVQFGGCQRETINCLVTPAGWNYAARLYRPRKEVIDGTWVFPEPQPVK
jgi:para-nitrobenzyl esterase